VVENASVNDTDTAAIFFFTTDGKTFMSFNYYIHNLKVDQRRFNSSIYVLQRPSSTVGCDFVNAVLNVGGSGDGDGGGNNNDVMT
jgi:hypothetical protein